MEQDNTSVLEDDEETGQVKMLTIRISDDLFWGFEIQVPMQYALFVDPVVLMTDLKTSLLNLLHKHNLLQLVDKADKLKLHLDRAILPSDNILYVCTHCCKNV